jgi:predicted AAA+ superfamily ATPase
LLGLRDENQVNLHYLKGALFENLILSEFIKRKFNRGENYQPYFWQDSHGKEIDCLLISGEKITPVEIKSGKTMSTSYFDNLKYWRPLVNLPQGQGYVVYGGDESMQTSAGTFVSWRQLERIPD